MIDSAVLENAGLRISPAQTWPGATQIPSNPMIAAMFAAICAGGHRARTRQGGWHSDEDGHPAFKFKGSLGGSITVYPEFDEFSVADCALPDVQALWTFIEELNPFTTEVAFAVLAELCASDTERLMERAHVQSTVIRVDRLLRHIASDARDANLRQNIATEMVRLPTLAFRVQNYAVFDAGEQRWHREGVSWSGDRLFDIVEVRGKCADLQWVVRAGQWADWWLNPAGRYWVGELAAGFVELSTSGKKGWNSFSTKLGRRLTLLSVALRHPPIIVRRVDRLLADVGELPVPELRAGHWAGRTRTRLERSLKSLQEIGVVQQCSWPDGHGPDDARAGRWVDEWLTSRVSVAMPLRPSRRAR